MDLVSYMGIFFLILIFVFLVKRAANTGWGHKEDTHSRWDHDKFDDSTRNRRQSGRSGYVSEWKDSDKSKRDKSHDIGSKWYDESKHREDRDRRDEKRSRRDDRDSRSKDRSKDTYDEYHQHKSRR